MVLTLRKERKARAKRESTGDTNAPPAKSYRLDYADVNPQSCPWHCLVCGPSNLTLVERVMSNLKGLVPNKEIGLTPLPLHAKDALLRLEQYAPEQSEITTELPSTLKGILFFFSDERSTPVRW
jgi:hypothetical protein